MQTPALAGSCENWFSYFIWWRKKKQGKEPAIQIYWSHSRGQTSEIHSALLLLATRFNSFLFNVWNSYAYRKGCVHKYLWPRFDFQTVICLGKLGPILIGSFPPLVAYSPLWMHDKFMEKSIYRWELLELNHWLWLIWKFVERALLTRHILWHRMYIKRNLLVLVRGFW